MEPSEVVMPSCDLTLWLCAARSACVQPSVAGLSDRNGPRYSWIRPVAEHAFTLQLPLKPGVNEIEIYSRDEPDLRGSLSLGLYRETVTAARDSEGGATR